MVVVQFMMLRIVGFGLFGYKLIDFDADVAIGHVVHTHLLVEVNRKRCFERVKKCPQHGHARIRESGRRISVGNREKERQERAKVR